MLLARTRRAAVELTRQFKKRLVRKTYWALLSRRPFPREGRIRASLNDMKSDEESDEEKENGKRKEKKRKEEENEFESEPDDYNKFVREKKTKKKVEKFAITEYKEIEHVQDIGSFVLLHPETGRKHQLRKHAAEILKAPILGDLKYGQRSEFNTLKSVLPGQNKLHLHARAISFTMFREDGKIGERQTITATLPEHMQKTWKELGLSLEPRQAIILEKQWHSMHEEAHKSVEKDIVAMQRKGRSAAFTAGRRGQNRTKPSNSFTKFKGQTKKSKNKK
eukprot:TRINITY_DN3126_c0_g1_i2.p1 TRINITY_DN3126_c0_g1~~TRINITY_DN3126_c0_g1_i2.p1  ORF type:complete len:278 (-),score=60.25 TRINITY_DN3126_c0_g1_i2:8-841(-)